LYLSDGEMVWNGVVVGIGDSAPQRIILLRALALGDLAAALRVPSVVISTGDNPARWAPIDRARHHVLCCEAGVDRGQVIEHAAELIDKYDGELSRPWASQSELQSLNHHRVISCVRSVS
jgi:hypothetical protein